MRLHTLKELDKSEGTVQLREATSTDGTDSSLVLFPHPSPTDPNDPLRWPKWKKHIAFGSICSAAFLTNYGIGGLAPAFYILSLEFDKTMPETSHLLLWPIFVLGLFNFFWVPMANYFGKRPIFVFASLLLSVCFLWGAVATSFESLFWSNVIAAFAGSSTEAVGVAIVNDLYFLHERGAKMGIYTNAISGGNTIGPLICGFVVQGLGWRWHKWIAMILTAVNFLFVLFFVPETRYDREPIPSVTPTPTPSSHNLPPPPPYGEKGMSNELLDRTRTSEDVLPQLPKKTFVQELSLWSGTTETNLLKTFARPLPMIAYPPVIYAFLCYSISLVIVVAVNILNPFVLQAPPYNWKPQINGLINIPGFMGNVVGAYLGGSLVDWFCDWRTRKNGGMFEPESRLYMLIWPYLLTPAGCLMFGYGVERTLHWMSMFMGYALISVALTATPTVTMTYVSDCALPVNADALLLVNGLKNIVAFGFLYGVVPWVEQVGYVDCFATQAAIFVAVVGFGAAILIKWGATLRHVTSQWRIIL